MSLFPFARRWLLLAPIFPPLWAAAAVSVRTDPGEIKVVLQNATPAQRGLIEKLNRADAAHLGRLKTLVVPEADAEELSFSPLPLTWDSARPFAKVLVVDLAGQAFGGYENGRLVRWGPVSSGAKSAPTAPGLYHLNWRSRKRSSTVDPAWVMTWYFNFDSPEGQAFHAYTLPGQPASHSCIRMLRRDARWLYDWGEGWTLDATQTQVATYGTPVWITGEYRFDEPPPWRSADWWTRPVDLPDLPPDAAAPGVAAAPSRLQ